ncbi:hypothetical protein ACIP9H_33465 [Streptomyces sp. NPDC088732]|uniref:hypothetical protein n=1 Tax=Streptomyces sp. NPDC088732 TaxID=3365879 RepID=UPI00382BB303
MVTSSPQSRVHVTVPTVPDTADVYRSWRKVLTGLDETAEGMATVVGPEVGHGATITTQAGALLLVVDHTVTGWADPYLGGKRYALLDAALTLSVVQEDGALKALWSRVFKTSKSAMGAATRAQLRKHLAAHPPVDGQAVAEVDPGPGRPNLKPGPCRWCAAPLLKSGGVIVGRGEDVEIEHRRLCPTRPADVGTPCGLCGVEVAPGTAAVVMVREGDGRWETRHKGGCEGQMTLAEHEAAEAARRAEADKARAAEKAKQQRAAARKATAAEKRRAKEAAEKAAAEEMQRRVESLTVVGTPVRRELYDKSLGGRERMRLEEVSAVLSDGRDATWWEVAAYGGHVEDDDRGGRFYVLGDARWEYQRYVWSPEPYRPAPRPAVGNVPCPADGAKHCANCGTTEAPAGWMLASLGLACDSDCYTAMSDGPGAHARRFHR